MVLQLNGQHIDLQSIATVTPKTAFEKSTIEFIKAWQAGQKTFILHTSGSTGVPKEITIKREQMEASARLTIGALGLTAGQTSFLCLPTDFIGGKMMLVRSLINAMHLVAVEPTSNPLQEPTTANFAAMTPMQAETVLQAPNGQDRLNKLDKIILGGSAVSPELQKKLEQLDSEVYSTYGMTETVSHIALKKLNGKDKTDYFQAFEGIELGTDERECLAIKGAITDDHTIKTNDRVRLLENNQFEWLGRVDNVINTGGIKVQSEKIEAIIEGLFTKLKIKNRFFIGAVPDSTLGEKITLFIEGDLSKPTDSLKHMFKESLSRYECPKSIITIDKFAETNTGKINRSATLQKMN